MEGEKKNEDTLSKDDSSWWQHQWIMMMVILCLSQSPRQSYS
jgi:hypothetical protein